MAQKERGFEVVVDEHRQAKDIFTDEKGKKHEFLTDIKLPTRADVGSAGYDFYIAKDVEILPTKKTLIWTDVKAYMKEDEVLSIHIRSSLAVKLGLMLTNSTGIVDASYYSNEGNDGNIAIAVVNTSGKVIKLKKGDRIAQGIFTKFLVADEDDASDNERVGGIGSSGR